MEPLTALARATDLFDRRLAGVAPDRWGDPTPCPDWTVLQLIDHVVVGNRWSVHVVNGATAEEAFTKALGEPLGDDRLADYRTSAGAQLLAFSQPGVDDRICHHLAGDIPGRRFLGFRIADLTLHAWDLARATGGDEQLDDDVVALLWQRFSPIGDQLGSMGMWGDGPSGTVDESAPLQQRLLDLTGRRP